MQTLIFLILTFFFVTTRAVIKVKAPFSDYDKAAELTVNKKINTQKLTICMQVFVEEFNEKLTFFSTSPDVMRFTILIRSKREYGFIQLNTTKLIFTIPMETYHPFAWFPICFTKNSTYYSIVSLGRVWYEFKIPASRSIKEDLLIESMHFGMKNGPEISEVNIWSEYFDRAVLFDMTKNCSKVLPKPPNILNWSDVSKESFGDQNSELIIEESASKICHFSTSFNNKLIPLRYVLL